MTGFRFVFLADVQLGCYAAFSGLDEDQIADARAEGLQIEQRPKVEGFEWDSDRYRLAISAVNELRPAFVVIGGDLVNDLSDADQINEFQRLTRLIDPKIPVRLVPGNHDIAFDFTAPTPESVATYRRVFGEDHYSFVHDRTLFIVLNTPVIDHPEHVPEMWPAQLDFLNHELDRASVGEIDHIVLFGHHPLFVESPDEQDSYWNLPRPRREAILQLIHRHRVSLAIAGHLHRNSLARDGDFVQVVSGPVGLPLGSDPSGLRVVEVGPGGVSHLYRSLE